MLLVRFSNLGLWIARSIGLLFGSETASRFTVLHAANQSCLQHIADRQLLLYLSRPMPRLPNLIQSIDLTAGPALRRLAQIVQPCPI